MEDKQEKIINELKRRAEEMRFGSITVEFKIHEGKLAKGDIIEKRETLG
jgi:hypothetical protein